MDYKNILVLIIILILIDSIYLSLLSKQLTKQIKDIQGYDLKVNYLAALMVYVLLAFGLYYFTANEPNLDKKILNAAVLGLVSYAIFDLTTIAIFDKWSITLATIDIIWGSVLSASSVYLLEKIIKN